MSAGAGRKARSGPRYTTKPKWLLDSFSALEKFQRTSEEVRESFNELQVSFVNFNDKAEAAAMDEQHRQRLFDGPRKVLRGEAAQLAGEAALRQRWCPFRAKSTARFCCSWTYSMSTTSSAWATS